MVITRAEFRVWSGLAKSAGERNCKARLESVSYNRNRDQGMGDSTKTSS